jgi:molecular chaperone IbpA
MPVTASSGTGLAGMETRSMKFDRSRAARLIAALGGGDSIADEGDWGEDNLQNIYNNLTDGPIGGRDPLRGKKRPPYRGCAGPSGLHDCTGSGHTGGHRMSLKGGYAMRTFDLAPLYRSTVGFDRLFSMLDGFEAAPGYPPYNIERTGENDYRITVAVAGFGENELSLEAKENTLTIKGEKQVKQDNTSEVLYQGIAGRAFERQFQLADYVQVKGASLENGLLHVDLVREIPEAKKPRQIAINGQSKPQVVESKVAA